MIASILFASYGGQVFRAQCGNVVAKAEKIEKFPKIIISNGQFFLNFYRYKFFKCYITLKFIFSKIHTLLRQDRRVYFIKNVSTQPKKHPRLSIALIAAKVFIRICDKMIHFEGSLLASYNLISIKRFQHVKRSHKLCSVDPAMFITSFGEWFAMFKGRLETVNEIVL